MQCTGVQVPRNTFAFVPIPVDRSSRKHRADHTPAMFQHIQIAIHSARNFYNNKVMNNITCENLTIPGKSAYLGSAIVRNSQEKLIKYYDCVF